MTINRLAHEDEKSSLLSIHTNIPSHFTHTGRIDRFPSRPPFTRTKSPNDILREMQGLQLQIKTPGSTGNIKDVTEASPKDVTKNSNYQEMLTPPTTPSRAKIEEQFPSRQSLDAGPKTPRFEFTPDLSQADFLGEGVWSKVYRVPATPLPPCQPSQSTRLDTFTPPSTPQKPSFQLPRAYALKTATRQDAAAVFEAEAAVLTHIQQHEASSEHVIPFLGLCNSDTSSSLLFHCADAGTLESLIESTTKQPLDQTLDLLLNILPKLLSSLSFLQNTTNVIHADIKPANILLTTTSCPSSPQPRFADFSTSFIASESPPPTSGAGTWSFMSPEQLSRDPTLNTPTFSSDIYALGITLLSFLCGTNPFSSLLDNGFRLREAVKSGDAISWALHDFEIEKRLLGLQKCWKARSGEGKLLDLLSGALKKKREDRWTANEWRENVEVKLQALQKKSAVGLGIRC